MIPAAVKEGGWRRILVPTRKQTKDDAGAQAGGKQRRMLVLKRTEEKSGVQEEEHVEGQ